MADEACTGTWDSKFNPHTSGEEDDGQIEINEVNGNLQGKHHKSNASLNQLSCDGTTMSFNREETVNGVTTVVSYQGKITQTSTKFKIKGKFTKAPKVNDAVGVATEEAYRSEEGNTLPPNGGDDWEAEKPSA